MSLARMLVVVVVCLQCSDGIGWQSSKCHFVHESKFLLDCDINLSNKFRLTSKYLVVFLNFCQALSSHRIEFYMYALKWGSC